MAENDQYIPQDAIQKQPDIKRFPTAFPETWFVDQRSLPYFTGRQEIMEQIQPILSSDRRAVALTGSDGIGKTAIAVQYAYQDRGQYMDDGVLFLNATSGQTLEEECQRFLAKYNHTSAQGGIEGVLSWLNGHKNALVILDHVADADIAHRFVSGSENHLLLTSQAAIDGVENIQVGALEDRDGAEVLLKRSNTLPARGKLEDAPEKARQSALELSQLLAGVPSKLINAGKYVEETGSSITRYLGLVKSGVLPT